MLVYVDSLGCNIAVVTDIRFMNKQGISWDEVQRYIESHVNTTVKVSSSDDVICIGKKLPDEYTRSRYTRSLKGARAKAKANAAQIITEMIETAYEKQCSVNNKRKHASHAVNGWVYYKTRFAIPIYDNDIKTDRYNIYSARLVINVTSGKRFYLYDIVDIKKRSE